MVDALSAKDTMFKKGSHVACPWPIKIVPQSDFSLSKEDICMTKNLGDRSFEYGASWVEHYYSNLVAACREQDRMELVVMLYRWYVAQFSLDYLNDVDTLSKGQFLEASNVLNPPEGALSLREHRASAALQACLQLMQDHDETLYSLPAVTAHKISSALNDFYMVVAQQCEAEQGQSEDPLKSMSLADYMDYRTTNAGGLMGFVRQTYLFSLLDKDSKFPTPGEMDSVAYLVGKNIALINDLYGLRKDQVSGEPNILLKHAREMGDKNHHGSLQPSIAWALEEIKQTVRDVVLYYDSNPDSLITKHNIALGCISGNHGFHECSKRYELPEGFSWSSPVSSLIGGCNNHKTWCLVTAIVEERRRKKEKEKFRRWDVQPISVKTQYQPVCLIKRAAAF